MRRLLASLVGLLVLGSWVAAEAPPRHRWTTGQVLLYRVRHVTDASDIVGDNKSTTKSVLEVTKRWQVNAVDANGVATIQLTLASMFQERTTPSGDVLRYDSADPAKSTPALKEALSRYVNTPLATLRVDATGRVVEVKESKSDASSYENELPFLAILPETALQQGQTWERNYKITLAPPLGTGEKHDAVQKYTCKSVTGDLATFSLGTDLKNKPTTDADSIPLWQMMPTGEFVFDVKNGRLHSAKLTITREVKNHQGENSSCQFQSTMNIEYAGDR